MDRTRRFLKFFTSASILVWCCMLYMLNDRIRSQTLLEVDPKMTSEGDVVLRDEWLGLYMDSACVGYSNIRLARTLRETEYEVQTESLLSVNVGGVRRRIETNAFATVNDNIEVKSFKFQMFSSMTQFMVSGAVNPDSVRCTLTAGEGQTHKFFRKEDFPIPDGPLCLPETLRFYILQRELLPGEEIRVNLLDAATLSLQEATVKRGKEEKLTVLGEEIEGIPYIQTFGALTSTVWLDSKGEILRESSNMGGLSLVSHRQEKTDLLAVAGKGTGPDILAKSRIAVDVGAEDPRQISRLRLKMYPVDMEDFPDHGFQILSVDGDYVTIETTSGSKQEALGPEDTRQYLVETESMPLQNEKIQKTLKRIVHEQMSDLEKAARIANWVHDSMSPEPVLSFPNAGEVIATLKGDCNEHAVLFGAMARASGIPTRVCAGLMLLEDHFYYHAWNEVYIEGKWHAVDTTLEQDSSKLAAVDATHLKFVEGELSHQVALLGLIGKLKMQVLYWEEFGKEGI